VITPTGGIRMTGPNGELAGNFFIAPTGSSSATSLLQAGSRQILTLAGVMKRCTANTERSIPAGYMEAGRIALVTSGDIFVQNTGTATDLRGSPWVKVVWRSAPSERPETPITAVAFRDAAKTRWQLRHGGRFLRKS
jgi:hypothetical protein